MKDLSEFSSVSKNGRVRFTRAAGWRRSGATSPLDWTRGDVGEVNHLGQLGQPIHVNGTLPVFD